MSNTETPQESAAEDNTIYSTRGRAPQDEVIENLLSLSASKKTESFLSDTLTEEERRTKTRTLPNVDGFIGLRKQEVKNDLNIARGEVPGGMHHTTGGMVGSSSNSQPAPSIAHTTEKLTAYTPPRPPESVGIKKQHRIVRWERRVHDIEVDLSNYRKTVSKTQQELRDLEGELERTRAVDYHIVRNYLHVNDYYDHEVKILTQLFQDVQNECAEYTTDDRLRTRGSNRNFMRDVLSVLSSKPQKQSSTGTPHVLPVGVGGIPVSRDTNTAPASSWVVAGDVVETQYGPGTVLKTLPAQPTTNGGVLPARVSVKLPFGTAFLNVTDITNTTDPTTLSDEQLAERWGHIMADGKASGLFLDPRVDLVEDQSEKLQRKPLLDGDDAMETDDEPAPSKKRRIDFGTELFTTEMGRDAMAYDLDTLKGKVRDMLEKGRGVLGYRSNPGVPKPIRDLEDSTQRTILLKAKVNQLRNQVKRQRRIRILNERTNTSIQEKASRVENLVHEMRSDLKNLKMRLDTEIKNMGISDETVDRILTSYYVSLDTFHGEASPPKRPRRPSRFTDDFGDDTGDKLSSGDVAEEDKMDSEPPTDTNEDKEEATDEDAKMEEEPNV